MWASQNPQVWVASGARLAEPAVLRWKSVLSCSRTVVFVVGMCLRKGESGSSSGKRGELGPGHLTMFKQILELNLTSHLCLAKKIKPVQEREHI